MDGETDPPQAPDDQEAWLRLLLDSTAEGILGLDLDDRCTFANRSSIRQLGFHTEQDLLGSPLHDLIHHKQADGSPLPRHECAITRSLHAAAPAHRDEDVFWRTDGTCFPVEYWSYPIRAENGATGAVIAFVDITERKRAEEAIRHLNRELEERVAVRTTQFHAASEDLESFSYSVSHDLRAPLRAIDGFSLILLEDYAKCLDDEGRRLLRVIRTNAQQMGRLIDDILAFARAGRRDPELEDVDMTGLARAVFADLTDHHASRAVRLELEALAPCRADPSMVRQALEHLLANALKFTRPRAVAVIEITARPDGPMNVYTIRDNGVGFDMAFSHHLFNVFQRLHGPEQFEGTGIGLAIARRLINKHGGRIWAEGKVGEGATFSFTLPRAQETTEE
ncbi:MAG TPA: ATP-binding protein [Stenomitos sp.]